MSISIESTVKQFPHTNKLYEEIANAILGKKYELSLVFIGPARAKKLNEEYRKKTYSPNVLSFPLDKHAGEIFICPTVAKTQAKRFTLSQDGYVAYLFIHGCLHLKGHDHSDTMEQLEERYLRRFGIT